MREELPITTAQNSMLVIRKVPFPGSRIGKMVIVKTNHGSAVSNVICGASMNRRCSAIRERSGRIA